MALLEHANIRTFDLKATIDFYCDVIGLRTGEFPGPAGRGAWLYDDADVPVIHLINLGDDCRDMALDEIGRRVGELGNSTDLAAMHGGGAVDHIAFRHYDYDGLRHKLEERGLPYTTNDVPSMGLRQLFVNDPSGVTLELNFRD